MNFPKTRTGAYILAHAGEQFWRIRWKPSQVPLYVSSSPASDAGTDRCRRKNPGMVSEKAGEFHVAAVFQVDDVSWTPGLFMDTLYDVGNRSLLYMEAVTVQEKMIPLRHITKFIRHVLTFAVRGKSPDGEYCASGRLSSDNEKTFTPAMYKILSGAMRHFRRKPSWKPSASHYERQPGKVSISNGIPWPWSMTFISRGSTSIMLKQCRRITRLLPLPIRR